MKLKISIDRNNTTYCSIVEINNSINIHKYLNSYISNMNLTEAKIGIIII